MEQIVYVLHHTARVGKDEDHKLIGVYSTKQHAEAVILRLRDKPGFRDPDGEFVIGPYELDKDNWIEGFGIDF